MNTTSVSIIWFGVAALLLLLALLALVTIGWFAPVVLIGAAVVAAVIGASYRTTRFATRTGR